MKVFVSSYNDQYQKYLLVATNMIQVQLCGLKDIL
jgi:hypothetical protein